MATKITINIDLKKLPKEAIKDFKHQDGNYSAYINLDINDLREADEKGNTKSVSVYLNGERTYVGRGKVVTFGEGAQAAKKPTTTPQIAPVAGGYTEQENDLPFN